MSPLESLWLGHSPNISSITDAKEIKEILILGIKTPPPPTNWLSSSESEASQAEF